MKAASNSGTLKPKGHGNASHVPEVCAHLLGHAYAIPRVSRRTQRIIRIPFEIVHLHPLIKFKPPAGEDYPLLGLHGLFFSFLLNDRADHGPLGIGQEDLSRRSVPYRDFRLSTRARRKFQKAFSSSDWFRLSFAFLWNLRQTIAERQPRHRRESGHPGSQTIPGFADILRRRSGASPIPRHGKPGGRGSPGTAFPLRNLSG